MRISEMFDGLRRQSMAIVCSRVLLLATVWSAHADTNEVSRSDATSPEVAVNAKVTTGTVAVRDAQTIAYSTAWQSALAEADARIRISVRRADGTGSTTVLLDQTGPCSGAVAWSVAGLSDGSYTLTYEVLDGTGKAVQTTASGFIVAGAVSRSDATSPEVAVNAKVTTGTVAVQDAQSLAYSTAWQSVLAEADARIRISVQRADGTGGTTVLLDQAGPCAGTVAWGVAGLSDGNYTLKYEVLDGTVTAVQTSASGFIVADAVSRSDATSPEVAVNAKVTTGTVAVRDAQTIAYSTAWQSALAEADARIRISVRRADGTGSATVLLDQAGPCAGTVPWSVAGLSDGSYTLKYEVLDGTGKAVQTSASGFIVAGAVSRSDATSPEVAVNAKVTTGTVAVQDAQGLAYSTAWQSLLAESDARIRISVRRADGTGSATVLLDRAGPCAGTVAWGVAGFSDGSYTLKYEVLDGTGKAVQTSTSNLILARNDAGGCVVSGLEVNAKAGMQTLFAHDVEKLAYSTRWQSAISADQAKVRVTAQRTNDTATVLCAVSGSCSGIQKWDTEALEPGRYTLRHEVQDGDGNAVNTLAAQVLVLNGTVALHGGMLATNETWAADIVHVVTETVIVPSGVTLTIESGAIVKFCDGTGIQVLSGGTLIANGARFTNIADDALDGDTNMDGSGSKPTPDSYTISGAGTLTMDSSTELRYTTQKTSGTISGSTMWLPGRTYCITGDITVASGGTLTIPAGTILKFSAGKSLVVNSGGTLSAVGTRAQPIIFTSVNDDTYGGDTNGDGDNTAPQPGDWTRIGVTGGTANMNYVSILYSSKNETTGAINVNGGSVTFVNGIIAHGLNDAVGVESGSFFMTNSVVQDCLVAFRHWPRDPIVNCVIYDCGRITQGGGQTFVNCSFSKIAEVWEAFGFPRSTYKNCDFYNDSGSVLQGQDVLSAVGSNGNIWGDPLFSDPENGDFTLQAGSPCIDAGDGTVAPDTDYYGTPRVNTSYVTPTGTPDAQGNYADIGAFEFVSSDALSDIDLAVDVVFGTDATAVGDNVTVTWRVINNGSKPASGSRVDSVFISAADPALGEQRVALGEKIISDTLQPGEAKEYSATFKLPSAQNGTWAYAVTANSNRGIFEGSLTANNTKVSGTTFQIVTPSLSYQTITPSLAAGESSVWCLDSDLWQEGAVITLSSSALTAFVGAGYAPSASHYDYQVIALGDGHYVIVIPPRTSQTSFYLTLQNSSGSTITPSIEVQPLSFKLWSIGTKSISNSGEFVISLKGTRLDEVSSAKIISGSSSYSASWVEHLSSTEVSMHLDLLNIAAGAYTVQVDDGQGNTSQLTNALTVVAGALYNQNNFYARFEMPTYTRAGRAATAYFIYGNNGKTDLPAPHITILPGQLIGGGWQGGRVAIGYAAASAAASAVSATNATGQKTSAATIAAASAGGGAWVSGQSLLDNTKYQPDDTLYVRLSQNEDWQNGSMEIFATSATYPVSMLKAGEERRIPVFYKETASLISVLYLSWKAAYEPNANSYPWESNAASMRPAWANDETWSFILANLKANVGETWDDYQNKLRGDLDYLASKGFVTDRAGAAWQMEVNDAIAPNGQPAVLASATDIGVAVRGGSIGVKRIYGSSLRRRFTQGIFGYGWTHGYDYAVKLEASQKQLYVYFASQGIFAYTYDTTVNSIPQWKPTDTDNKVQLTETTDAYVLTDRQSNVIRLDKTTGHILSSSDNAGNAASFEYVNTNTLAAVRHTDGRCLLFTYSGGLVSQVTDDQSSSVSYTYDGGCLTSVRDNVSSNVTTYAYSSESGIRHRALTQVGYPDGTTLDYLYDAMGRVASVSKNGNQQTVAINYESSGIASTVDASGALTRAWYGPGGQPLAVQDALGGVTRYTYDVDRGLLTSVTLPNGTVTRIDYDADNNPSKVVSPKGVATGFASDSMGLLTSFTDARGKTTRYTRDAKGNTLAVVYPDASQRAFTYDAKNLVVTATNRRKQQIALVRDDFGRVTQRTYPDGRTFTYTYNAKNRLLTVSDTLTGTITFTYDSADRLHSVVYPDGKGFTYTYDVAGRLIKRVSEDGFALNYTYGADGNLAAVSDKDGKEYVRYTFDDLTGRIASSAYGNGTRTEYAFDLAGRVTGITHKGTDAQPLAFFNYAYDANYDIAAMTNASGVTAYAYDAEHQLVQAAYPGGATNVFAYDTVGNRVTADGVSYTVNALNQYTQVGDTACQYDADGNLIRKGAMTFEYDAENRLVRRVRSDGAVWSCAYNALGQRVQVVDGGVTNRFIYDAVGNLAVECDGTGTLTRRYIRAGRLIADQDAAGTRRYYHADLQGSTRALTGETGTVIGTADYNAFGAITASTGASSRFGYVGAFGVVNDGDGILFMKNRYYDSDTARFVQEDPLGLNGRDVNLFRYCGNDPLSKSDPLGFQAISCEDAEMAWKKLQTDPKYNDLKNLIDVNGGDKESFMDEYMKLRSRIDETDDQLGKLSTNADNIGENGMKSGNPLCMAGGAGVSTGAKAIDVGRLIGRYVNSGAGGQGQDQVIKKAVYNSLGY